ncbi:DUF5693 family protein [Paenibacillus gyeongsangnamensis]|uniref:DUF5693 family protein n=1 Tax=Paenibacillus gyeongsangnamensis TaxID=3388067 RepID=UPI0022B8ECF8|nr:DUF5693 family protein [Paenibacillus filicis]
MRGRYVIWNQKTLKWLWWLVILGILAAIPVAYERHVTEQNTGRKVEIVFDYRNLLDISDTQTDPRKFVLDQLDQLKQHGVQSMAVYEATLNELKQSRRIELFTSHEASSLTQTPISPNENFTYLLFAEKDSEQKLRPMIQNTFAALNVKTRPWSYKNQPGMIIEMSMDDAMLKTMDPDPITLQLLKEKGYNIVVRMSNRRPFDEAQMDTLLGELQKLGVKRMIVDGETVPGFISDKNMHNLDIMGELLKKHQIGLASTEALYQKVPQRGFARVAKDINYNVVRLHPLTESDTQKLTENVTEQELNDRIQAYADRFVLAVKDRNIRMIFLHAKAVRSTDKGKIVNPLDSIYLTLKGPDGALPRIQKAGYQLGPATSFVPVHSGWQPIAKGLIWLGAAALIALTVSYFFPEITLLVFVVLLLGTGLLYLKNANTFAQVLALGAGTSSPTLAIMYAIRAARSKLKETQGSRLVFAILLLLRTSLISLIGVLFIVGLLNHITYSLVLDQFRGVSVLHAAPIALAAVYWLLFSDNTTYREKLLRINGFLRANITILWVVTVVVIAAVGYYYISRTGNEGQTSAVEKLFRSFLENTLGVRPRTKEFLIAHPLFLLGAYLSYRYRSALLFILVGVIGQASIVDTFAHLHTPLKISLIRIIYGLGFGTLIGIALIVVWEIVSRSWRRWVPRLNE